MYHNLNIFNYLYVPRESLQLFPLIFSISLMTGYFCSVPVEILKFSAIVYNYK